MSSNEIAIKVEALGKRFEIYDRPGDRLKQFLLPRIRSLFGMKPKQYFREFWALKDISFEVRKGDTVGIIGRNGSGKSTLLQIICGTLTPTNGMVRTSGRIAALLELGSGFNPEFTGRENVYLNASVLGLSKEETDDRFDDIVRFADIGDFIDQPTKTYSSGMMVRLAFAVIAHVDADILVIDEALAVGDAFFTQKCMRFLRTFMKTGSILFVSHDTATIRSFCNGALWIERGKTHQSGTPKDVCESYLEAFYEAQQGKSSTTKLRSANISKIISGEKDQRIDFLNTSNLRNDLQIFRFNPDAESFGTGDAKISQVVLLDENENILSWVVGGEKVMLRITVSAMNNIDQPIVGFFIKDRLGQTLFGDNTFLNYQEKPIPLFEGQALNAEFIFYMPIFPVGSYSINVAIANGTQTEHVQLHWIHDALIFKSESDSVSTGLIGIPMLNIEMNKIEINF